MKTGANKYFTRHDLDRIAAAVKAAEQKTSGEIVPYFVEESDDYEESVWRSAVFFGAVPLLILAGLRLFSNLWLTASPLLVSLLFFTSTALGASLAFFLPPVKRFFSGREVMHRRCSQRAAQAFVSEEVFRTRDRTGILIFMSFMERTVVVLGDSGINRKVQQHEWDTVVGMIVSGMKDGRATEGLVTAVAKCGELLRKRGVKRRRDDTDELSDNLRTSRR